ncbi:Tim17/Tim22/Tim23/Pmp24 family-domain-containing protein [Dunaliella salina]|uniref:Tim17/Tim22/Tim23/Pmp24 family-domain-containing protein n=1 Tax=Dunaliella salina TaxID=3046 RepID=A0ABQ7GCX5_DUNSA|nr:Tim17/Tim22/Tim23/Pmp24 family-domain-containing protein [Dunaliella salina]|eukprot:KAF5832439.1 Tim17/Tim22/Tim23/Pmp24 family-domain-containing protein [Dunaliella salina]
MAKNRTFAARGLWAADGGKSARALALVSGMYTWIHCLCQRIRLKEDGYNRGAAGCATGLVLGWKGGPASALQSCAGFGLISYILDFGGNSNTPPANAAMVEKGLGGSCLAGPGLHGGQQQASRNRSMCGSQGLDIGIGSPAAIVSMAPQAGQKVGKLNKQWWQRQQRQRQLQLPPVVWLACAMQPGYFKA